VLAHSLSLSTIFFLLVRDPGVGSLQIIETVSNWYEPVDFSPDCLLEMCLCCIDNNASRMFGKVISIATILQGRSCMRDDAAFYCALHANWPWQRLERQKPMLI
jgi:hypothetical protein